MDIMPANNIIQLPGDETIQLDFGDGDDDMTELPMINTFDIDGVIFMGDEFTGVWPGPSDIIVTGRSLTQAGETFDMLHERGIFNPVMFNPLDRFDPIYSREESGKHKGRTLRQLLESYHIGVHFEDDPIQISQIESFKLGINIVHLQHTLTVK